MRIKKYFLFFGVVLSVLLLLSYQYLNSSPVTYTQAVSNTLDTIKDHLDIKYVEDNLATLDQKDSQLIQYTRLKYLTPPSKLPYNLEKHGDHQDNFSRWVAKFFKNKIGGTFIEAGANRGERGSHTLYLEKELGWTGLLIECNPLVVPYLKKKHRKAWIAEVCLSPAKTSGRLNFSNPVSWSFSGALGQVRGIKLIPTTNWTYFEVQTIPLYTILAALGWNQVDYFSFDIEAQELNVLKNFPFDLFVFKVLIIEVLLYSDNEKKELDDLLKSKGYQFVSDKTMEVDKIYVHKNFTA